MANQSTISLMKCGVGTSPHFIRLLDRGAQTINRIIYPAAIGARIDHEIQIFPKNS
jgi:hypothetical protein